MSRSGPGFGLKLIMRCQLSCGRIQLVDDKLVDSKIGREGVAAVGVEVNGVGVGSLLPIGIDTGTLMLRYADGFR